MWSVEQATDCVDDFLVVPLDKDLYVTIRVEPFDPRHPVESATRAYAELLCNLLNSGVNDNNWVPAHKSSLVPEQVRKSLRKELKKDKKHG